MMCKKCSGMFKSAKEHREHDCSAETAAKLEQLAVYCNDTFAELTRNIGVGMKEQAEATNKNFLIVATKFDEYEARIVELERRFEVLSSSRIIVPGGR